MNPAITVLMPVYNGERYLEASILSVLEQTFEDFELLIIDDGSSDESAGIVESFDDSRIRFHRNVKNLGLVVTLNLGLEEATGEWIARQDADDLSVPSRLDRQIAFVRGNPSVPLLGSDATLIDEEDRHAGRWRTGGHADLVRWDLGFRTPFAHSTAFFRRSMIAERFGGYREARACEDLDLWSRVAMELPVVTLREPLVKYRLHGASVMASEHASEEKAGRGPLAEILRRNLGWLAPGLDDDDGDGIAAVWSGEIPESWADYFEAIEAFRLGFLRGREAPPGLGRLTADQNAMLYYRAVQAGQGGVFLRALLGASAGAFARLPWLRILYASLRR